MPLDEGKLQQHIASPRTIREIDDPGMKHIATTYSKHLERVERSTQDDPESQQWLVEQNEDPLRPPCKAREVLPFVGD